MKRWLRRAGYAVAGLVVLGFLPPVQARLKAVPVLAESVGVDLPRPFAHTVERTETSLLGVVGDLYTVGGPAPGIVLVPGAATEGKNDPRLVRAAQAIAAAGRTIFVPSLTLARRRFDERDIDRIAASTLAFAERPEVSGQPILVGISYGGSFALVAAADERLRGKVPLVATFGAYYDLAGVVQAITTGVSLVGDDRFPYRPHPRADEILAEVAGSLVPDEQRRALGSALKGNVDGDDLPPEATAVYRLVTNEDPAATPELARSLPEPARRTLQTFSPSSVAEHLDMQVIALHSTDDPAVPYGEGVRMERSLPDVRLYSVDLFEHVDLDTGRGDGGTLAMFGDLVSAWRFTGDVLSSQE